MKLVGVRAWRPACTCGWSTIQTVATAAEAKQMAERLHVASAVAEKGL